MTTLEEKVQDILTTVGDEINDMPYEERRQISKYLAYVEIRERWQHLNRYENLTTKAWRDKLERRNDDNE